MKCKIQERKGKKKINPKSSENAQDTHNLVTVTDDVTCTQLEGQKEQKSERIWENI